MPRPVGSIRQFHPPDRPDRPALLIFPHAGSGASAYRDFAKLLSTTFNVSVVQYPGRQDRAAEPALPSVPAMAAEAFADFTACAHRGAGPLAAFGHSMGALVAFEFVRLAEAGGIPVRQLTVSAAVAPSLVAAKPPHPTEDEDILNHLASLDGTDADVFAHREVMRLALPVIKADYRAFDSYDCADDVTVAAPIHALGGEQDPYVTLGDLYGWGKHTGSLGVTVFDGGHFFVQTHREQVAELLT